MHFVDPDRRTELAARFGEWTVAYIGLKQEPMNNIVNILIVLLIAGWLLGFIGFRETVGSIDPSLLLVAVILLV
jgi:hypothetical protein